MSNKTAQASKHEPSEADIIFNRASLALAKSQKLIASWLPPKQGLEDSINVKTSEAPDREDAEIFSSAPESLGLGAQIPEEKKYHAGHQTSSADQRLRQNILGKRASYILKKADMTPKRTSAVQPKRKRDVQEDSEGDEEGRTWSIGKASTSGDGGTAVKTADEHEHCNGDTGAVPTIHKRATGSYLDQLLSERSSKRKKKKKTKQQDTVSS